MARAGLISDGSGQRTGESCEDPRTGEQSGTPICSAGGARCRCAPQDLVARLNERLGDDRSFDVQHHHRNGSGIEAAAELKSNGSRVQRTGTSIGNGILPLGAQIETAAETAFQVVRGGDAGGAEPGLAPQHRRLEWSNTGPRMSTRTEGSATSLNRPQRYLAGSADRWAVLLVLGPQSIQPGQCVPILASTASMKASSDRYDRSMSRSSPRRVSPSASSPPDAKVSSASQPSPAAKPTLALFAA